ncbi:MAG: DUF2339 domain-containing protein [Candidatus Altiarchaeota archaeon]
MASEELSDIKDSIEKTNQKLVQVIKAIRRLDLRVKKLESHLQILPETIPQPAGAVGGSKSSFEEETKPEEPSKEKTKIEEDIGRTWFNRIGIISIFLGVAFFIKFGLEQDLLGPIGKVAVGIISGFVLIIAGELFDRRQYSSFARSLTGGGFAVLYLTFHAAHSFYGLISLIQSLGLLFIVSILTIVFSIRYNSVLIAAEAFLLGFLVGWIGGVVEYTLSYNILLLLGLAFLVTRREWGYLTLIGLLFVYLTHYSWMIGLDEFSFAEVGYLVAYMLIFNAVALTSKISSKKHEKGEFGELSHYLNSIHQELLVLVNAFFFYLILYYRLGIDYAEYQGLFTLCLGVFYLLLSNITFLKKQQGLYGTHLALFVLFITLTIPVQLDRELVTIGWAIEALVLVTLGVKNNILPLRVYGHFIAAATFFKTFFFDSSTLSEFDSANILGSTRLFAFIASIVVFYVLAKIIQKNKKILSSEEQRLESAYIIMGTILTTLLVGLEVSGKWISVAWSIFAVILLVVGFKVKYQLLRILGLLLLGITIVKVFVYDLASLKTIYRVMSFIVLGLILLVASFSYTKYRDILHED